LIWIHGHRHWFYIVKFDLFKNKEKMMSTSAAWMILIILFGDDWLESRNSLFKGRLCLSICVYIFIKKIMLSFMFILLFFYIFIKLSHNLFDWRLTIIIIKLCKFTFNSIYLKIYTIIINYLLTYKEDI